MSGHRRTLVALLRHPRPANLRWADIESLLVHLGAIVREGKGSAISVSLKGKTAYFHRPHPGTRQEVAIATAVRLLKEAGIDTDGPVRGGGD